jgi:hypothetical protein
MATQPTVAEIGDKVERAGRKTRDVGLALQRPSPNVDEGAGRLRGIADELVALADLLDPDEEEEPTAGPPEPALPPAPPPDGTGTTTTGPAEPAPV